jgi:hypothetical protein
MVIAVANAPALDVLYLAKNEEAVSILYSAFVVV